MVDCAALRLTVELLPTPKLVMARQFRLGTTKVTLRANMEVNYSRFRSTFFGCILASKAGLHSLFGSISKFVVFKMSSESCVRCSEEFFDSILSLFIFALPTVF